MPPDRQKPSSPSASPSPWQHWVDDVPVVRFIDVALRGAGQVMFQDHPLTGLIFLAAIFWGSWRVGVGSVVGLVVATATAMALQADKTELRRGLHGYNGLLIGAGITTFLVMTPLTWIVLVLGAAVSIVISAALARMLAAWSLPTLTAPFVLTTSLLLLCSYAFANLPIASMAPPALPADVPMAGISPLPSLANAGQSILMGFSQVFLVGDAGAGALILCGLMVGSRSAAWLATLGATTGFVAALVCGAPADRVAAGLYSFSPALTAIALGTVCVKPSGRAVWVAGAAALVTVFVHAGLTVVLSPLGIPPLTAPFVLATWCFLLGRRSAA